MKKSLLALAVLASIAGAAQAQSSVTIYGVLDMALQRQDLGAAAGSTTALDSGIQSGSRLGFKGSEDLGGGLKANFQLEMGINADTGASAQGRTFGRQSFVGLSGDFGAVNFGRQYSPLFIAVDSFDPFGTGITSGTAGVGTSGYGAAHFFVPGNPRIDNSISYSSNSMSGFAVNAIYGLGTETPGNNSAGRYMDVSGTYNAGPLFAELVYTDSNNTAGNNSTKSILAAGTYNFDVVTVHAAFQVVEDDGVGASAVDRQVLSLGVSVPMGAGTFIANYIDLANQNSLAGKADSSQIALGYTYSLSKRTNLYTSLSRTENEAKSAMGSDGGGASNGKNVKMFNIGIRHKF